MLIIITGPLPQSHLLSIFHLGQIHCLTAQGPATLEKRVHHGYDALQSNSVKQELMRSHKKTKMSSMGSHFMKMY